MRKTSLLAAAVLSFSLGAAANASTYLVTISGADTGSLTLTSNGPGADLGSLYISSGSGSINSHAVTLVNYTGSPSDASPNFYPIGFGVPYDDEFYPSNPYLVDFGGGLLFTDGLGAFYAIFGNADGLLGVNATYVQTINASGVSTAEHIDTFTSRLVAGTTPEPSSMVLLGTGLLGLAGTVRRKLAA